MGKLVDGRWTTQWYKSASDGAFVRPETGFRDFVTSDGRFQPEANRYRLYVSYACPWAHRTLIVRALRGLVDAIPVHIVAAKMGDEGWVFDDSPGVVSDPEDTQRLHEVYTRADASYTGRVTVPILWDTREKTIVNNESREIVRMFDTVFTPIASNPKTSFYSAGLHDRIEETIEAIYEPINNGVYRAGFATKQGAYESAANELFGALDHWDRVLGDQRYLCGDQITEADWFMFTTLVRFDAVYYSHFKCSRRRISDYASLSGYLRELYQVPGVAETVNMDHIRTHYFWSHETINPTRIVPIAPDLGLDAPHGR